MTSRCRGHFSLAWLGTTPQLFLEFQQNLSTLPIAVLVLVVRNNRIESIDPLVSELLLALENHAPRNLRRVGV